MTGETRDPVHGFEAERWGGWSWREPSRGEHYRTCSYCGSVHPEDLAVEESWRAEWADRKYGWPHKFYVHIPNRNPQQRFIAGASGTARQGPYAPGGEKHQPAPERYPNLTWVRPGEIPPDVITDGWRDLESHYEWVSIGTRPTHFAKFYTVHLADPAADTEALERIQRTSGLRFRFHDGRVSWEAFQEAGRDRDSA